MGGILNSLICGDNLEELIKLPKESVDLIYIDPPFFSNRQYEVVWGDDAEVRSFKDRWEGGTEHYIDWLKPRVQEMYEMLKHTGSFYLHCDWHASHYLKILCDEIFGHKNFQNEIIWHYSWGVHISKRWNRKHDTIFFYAKSNKWCFNATEVMEKRDQEVLRRLALGVPGATMAADKGKHLDKTLRLPHDVWDIPTINAMAKERLGYPTQKPEALLERIIKASSNKNDTVLDAFCGCGTACVVAQKLGRNWIGIDISPTAIKLVEKRLGKIGCFKDKGYISTGSPKTIKQLKKLEPFEFQNWVVNEMQGKQSRKKVGDMGLDGYMVKSLFHGDAGIQVKQSEKVGRNVVDNFKSALERAKYKKGYIVAFSFGKGSVEETSRLKNIGEIDIVLVKVEDLLLKKVKLT